MAFFDRNSLDKNKDIDKQNLPKHIAIIMDGNGRWAKSRGLNRKMGHRAGSEALKKLVEECQRINLNHLTVYAFSTENWSRPQEEVDALMNLLREYIKKYIDDADNNNIKFDTIGDISALPDDIQQQVKILYKKTENKTGLNFHIAINYGGRDEIIRALKKMYRDLNNKNINDISPNVFENYLDTKGIPDPELIIRTSGEQRLSNFLLWQSAYSEFYITDKMWPDFNINELYKAIKEYQNRNRRFGNV